MNDERLRRIRDEDAYERFVRVYHDAIGCVDSVMALRLAFDAMVVDFVDFLARRGLSEDVGRAILDYPFDAVRSSGSSLDGHNPSSQEPNPPSSESS